MATQYSRGDHRGRAADLAVNYGPPAVVGGSAAAIGLFGWANVQAALGTGLWGAGTAGLALVTTPIGWVGMAAAYTAYRMWQRRKATQQEQYANQLEHLEEQGRTESAKTQQQQEQEAATAFGGEIDNTFDALYAHSAIVVSLHDRSQRLTAGIENLLNPPSHDPSSSGIDWNNPNLAQPELERLLTAFNQQRRLLLNQLGRDDPSLGLSGIPELTIDDLVTTNATGSLEINELNVRALGARLGQVNATADTINSSVKTLQDRISAYDGTPAGRESLREELTSYNNRLQGFGRTVASIREPGATMPPRRSSAPSSGTSGGSPVPGTPAVGRTAEPTPPDTVLSLVAGWVARAAHHAAETRTRDLSTTLEAQLRSHQDLMDKLADLDSRVIPERRARANMALGDLDGLLTNPRLADPIDRATFERDAAQREYDAKNASYTARLKLTPRADETKQAADEVNAAREELNRLNRVLNTLREPIDTAKQACRDAEGSLEQAQDRRKAANEKAGRLDRQWQATRQDLGSAAQTAVDGGGCVERGGRRVEAWSLQRSAARFPTQATTPAPVSAQPGPSRHP